MNVVISYYIDGNAVESNAPETDAYEMSTVTEGSRTRVMLKTKRPLKLKAAYIVEPYVYESGSMVFVNGYQSWTETREYDSRTWLHSLDRVADPLVEKYHFREYGDSWFVKYDRNCFHGFTYSYVRHTTGLADLWGSYNEENAFLIIRHEKDKGRVVLQSDVQGRVVNGKFPLFDYVKLSGEVFDIQEKYFAEYGTCDAKPLRGYTSWYNDYQDISEEKLLKALAGIDKEKYDLFQIDDGYETFVGDWLDIDKEKFPNGLKGLVDKIHEKGLLAGIWLAPFVAELKSRVVKEHPDWIRKKKGGNVFAGCNWSGDVVLDIRKSEVREYIRKALEYYMYMGFDFFKLDFLYAAALCVGDGMRTRAEAMRQAMQFLREILKDKLILGCGVPLSSAFNLVEYCRVGPDLGLDRDDRMYMRFMHRERVSTKTTVQNTIYRHAMDGHVFRCDPDVYLLRDDNIKLIKRQKEAIVTIDHLFGALYLTSDNVAEYDPEKLAVLREAQKLSGARVIDIIRRGSKGPFIDIIYELEGRRHALRYNWLAVTLEKL